MPTTHTSYGPRTTRARKPTRNVITLHTTSSLVSVLSSLTQKSNGSSGSNSTVTQESVNRGKPRRARSPRREMERRSVPSSPKDVVGYGKPSSSLVPSIAIAEEEPSILSYCEEDPEGINEEYKQNMIKAKEEEALQRAEEESSRHSRYLGGPNAPQELEAYDPHRPHYHHDYPIGTIPEMGVVKNSPSSLYDSGISIRSTSPERESPVQQKTRKLLSKTQTKTSSKTSSKTQGKKPARPRGAERKVRLPEAPMPPPSPDPVPLVAFGEPSTHAAEAPGQDVYQYGPDPRLHPMQYQQQYGQPPMGYSPGQHGLLQHPDASRSPSVVSHASTSASGPSKPSPSPASDLPPKAGYDLLASKLSSTASPFSSDLTPPVYRRFEALQNYKLLHLQDEIAEAETHLDRLNAYLGEEARLTGKECSRRVDERMGGELHWRRKGIQDFLFAKIEEYNKALASYHSLSETLPSASPSQIASYKSMLSDLSSPLYPPERAFIDAAESDLVTITSPANSSFSSSGRASRLSPHATAAALLALIVAFKLVPLFLSRLVVGAVGGFALAGPDILAAWETHGWESGLKRVAVHAAVVLVLACAVG